MKNDTTKTYEERQQEIEWSNVKKILNQERHELNELAKQTYYERSEVHYKWDFAIASVDGLKRQLRAAIEKRDSAYKAMQSLTEKYEQHKQTANAESSAAIKATKLLKENPHINISQGTDFSVQVYVGEWQEDMEYLSSWTEVLRIIKIILTAS
jgi:hypothetical protein